MQSVDILFFKSRSRAPRASRDNGSARRPGSGKRNYKRKAGAALAFSTREDVGGRDKKREKNAMQ